MNHSTIIDWFSGNGQTTKIRKSKNSNLFIIYFCEMFSKSGEFEINFILAILVDQIWLLILFLHLFESKHHFGFTERINSWSQICFANSRIECRGKHRKTHDDDLIWLEIHWWPRKQNYGKNHETKERKESFFNIHKS